MLMHIITCVATTFAADVLTEQPCKPIYLNTVLGVLPNALPDAGVYHPSADMPGVLAVMSKYCKLGH